jgi:hypothetical protein
VLALVELPALVEPCDPLPPLHELATHTGALAFTGVLDEADGSTWADPFVSTFAETVGSLPAVLTCTVATGWFPVPVEDEPDDVALEPPLDCEALPPFEVEAMVTGAFAFTGAFAEADGLTVEVPVWLWPDWVELVLDEASCVEEPPLEVLATVTGALTLAGALADAAGSVPADISRLDPVAFTAGSSPDAFRVAVAVESSVGWAGLPGSASAGPAHPSATRAAPSARIRFITVYSFLALRERSDCCRTSRQQRPPGRPG